jgi:hypothetical protein
MSEPKPQLGLFEFDDNINDFGNHNGSGFQTGKVESEGNFFIIGHVTSSKNSKRIVSITRKGGGKTPLIINSKATMKYKKDFGIFYKVDSAKFRNICERLGYPIDIEFSFARKTAAEFDWINPLQTVQDMMVEYGWLPDDSTKYIRPFFGSEWVDKKNPGVYIKIIGKSK